MIGDLMDLGTVLSDWLWDGAEDVFEYAVM